jgi:DNA helicase-2/ATP-dependent DNA helicase PcrA
VKYGGLKFLEAAHVKDLLAVLRWADNPLNLLPHSACCSSCRAWGRQRQARARSLSSRPTTRGRRSRSSRPPERHAHPWKKFSELFYDAGDPNARMARPDRAGARVLQAAPWNGMYEHVHTRIGDIDQLELLSSQYQTRERFVTELTLDPPNATGDLSGQPIHDEGLPGDLDHPLGQGHGVGQRVRAQRGRGQLPERILDRQGRGHRRERRCCTSP